MTAAATFHAWVLACLASGHGGGDNVLRVDRDRYVIGEPRTLANGAMVGRIHRFTAHGLSDIGGYKIAADGAVIDLPLDWMRTILLAAPAARPPACVCGSDSEAPHLCGVARMSRNLAFGLFVLVMSLGVVGNFDYADQVRIEAEKKARFAEEAMRRTAPSPAPIWSSRCESRGQTFIAKRSDDKAWDVQCTGKRVRS